MSSTRTGSADRFAAKFAVLPGHYGAGHPPGLLALLRSKDPAWEIKSVKWLRTIETPEEHTGSI
ncbi:hypothetical protein PRN20_11920 [Devosia sp. ZB163]|uniref:hypothetical protein n=1 Tax=Devosia sp. ZB163 TaxID=3025938 RepID=UPI002360728E|nr:hypothetical protein [Devosia sp. ZB163]MDC9824441.1 hypothetical protein [Devosia sp. ZB163]